MALQHSHSYQSITCSDPVAPDWSNINLADTWPDNLNLKTLTGWRELLRALSGSRRKVTFDDASFFDVALPKYIFQEFHNLPNGNYSRRFSRGYITGFDISMLGHMRRARKNIAGQLAHCERVLDIGTAGGRTAAAIKARGVACVWGMDPSPYLLKHAANDHHNIAFIPGIAEKIPFGDAQLDGISICFVLHEMPPRAIRLALAECKRVLKPDGVLVIAEPSPRQLEPFQWRELFNAASLSRLYFKILAHHVYEPFLKSWHKLDKTALFREAGFDVKAFPGMPVNTWRLEKRVVCSSRDDRL